MTLNFLLLLSSYTAKKELVQDNRSDTKMDDLEEKSGVLLISVTKAECVTIMDPAVMH